MNTYSSCNQQGTIKFVADVYTNDVGQFGECVNRITPISDNLYVMVFVIPYKEPIWAAIATFIERYADVSFCMIALV